MQQIYTQKSKGTGFQPSIKIFTFLFLAMILAIASMAQNYHVTVTTDGNATNQFRGALLAANAAGGTANPTDMVWGTSSAGKVAANFYSPTAPAPVNMNAGALGASGGNQPHNNMMPYQTVTFCIALQGVFPARN